MKTFSIQENFYKLNNSCTSYNWYSILGNGPISGFRLNITFKDYQKIQNLRYSDLIQIFPGLQIFHDTLDTKCMKAYGRANRKVRFGDNKIETIPIQRIHIKSTYVRLAGEYYEIHHELYNILPTFLIPYKRYISNSVCKCRAHNRHAVINSTEEFPACRTTFRWQKDSEETGCVVIFDMDRKAYKTILSREEFRKCKRAKNIKQNS